MLFPDWSVESVAAADSMLGISIGAALVGSPYGGTPVYLGIDAHRTVITAAGSDLAFVSVDGDGAIKDLVAAKFGSGVPGGLRANTKSFPGVDVLNDVVAIPGGLVWSMSSLHSDQRWLFTADFAASSITSRAVSYSRFAIADGYYFYVLDGILKRQGPGGDVQELARVPISRFDPLIVTSENIIACGAGELWKVSRVSSAVNSVPIPFNCLQVVESKGTIYALLSLMVTATDKARRVFAYAVDEREWAGALPVASLPDEYRPGELIPSSIAVDDACVYVGFTNGGGIAKIHRSARIRL